MIKKLLVFLFSFLSVIAQAQTDSVPMADELRANGKIFVVIGVIAMIFIAIVVFLVIIERRLKKLEDKIKG